MARGCDVGVLPEALEAFSLVSQALEERPVWTLQHLLEERGAAVSLAAVEAALRRAAYTFQKGAVLTGSTLNCPTIGSVAYTCCGKL